MPMKFFTPAWHGGDLTDAEDAQVVPGYQAHVRRLLPMLPPGVQRLAAWELGLHDAVIRRMVLDRGADTLRWELFCGDLQRGYFDVALTYSGVRMAALDAALLAELCRGRFEALYDEVDRTEEGACVHRVLFYPYRELEVVFQDLTLEQTPSDARKFPRRRARFQELPARPARG